MELSALTLRVLLLFFPGVLCARLVNALTVHRERTPAQFLTNAFVLGFASYLLLYSGQWVCEGAANLLDVRPPRRVTFMDALMNDRLGIAWGEIVLAAGTGVALGLGVSAALNHKLPYRAARKVRISRRRGTLDLWGFVFDSPRTNWVVCRDLERGLIYFGWVEEFSETSERAELLLRRVEVVESASGTKLYTSDVLYFSQDVRAITIDIVAVPPNAGVEDGRPEFPTVRAVRRGDVQPGRAQSESHDPPAEHRHPSDEASSIVAEAGGKRRKRRR